MGRKNKNKKKKVNPKRERYAKFRKDKPTNLTLQPPELNEDQMVQVKDNDNRIDFFLKTRPRYPERYVSERKAKSKR